MNRLVERSIVDPSVGLVVVIKSKGEEVGFLRNFVEDRNVLVSDVVDPGQLLDEEGRTVDPHSSVLLEKLEPNDVGPHLLEFEVDSVEQTEALRVVFGRQKLPKVVVGHQVELPSAFTAVLIHVVEAEFQKYL